MKLLPKILFLVLILFSLSIVFKQQLLAQDVKVLQQTGDPRCADACGYDGCGCPVGDEDAGVAVEMVAGKKGVTMKKLVKDGTVQSRLNRLAADYTVFQDKVKSRRQKLVDSGKEVGPFDTLIQRTDATLASLRTSVAPANTSWNDYYRAAKFDTAKKQLAKSKTTNLRATIASLESAFAQETATIQQLTVEGN